MKVQTLRLSQFYRLRIRPLFEALPPASESHTYFIAEFFEIIGWLIEGVFCGYFSPKEADILWVNLVPLREYCGSPWHPLVSPLLSTEIEKLYRSSDPFRVNKQMPDGAQKAFELPLFPHALQLSDRWACDSLTTLCSSFLAATTADSINMKNADMTVNPEGVREALVLGRPINSRREDLLAGFVRTLEHMEESKEFFEFARRRSSRKNDFTSYKQRIGGLNAWRVPFLDQLAREKMTDLSNLLEFTLRTSIRNEMKGAGWSSIEQPLRSSYQTLLSSWENDHFMSFLELV
jgi:hypothetical protein